MEEPSRRRSGARRAWARHPVVTTVLVGCTLVGAVLGFGLLPEEWLAVRRILAGAVAGGGIGLLVTAPKMLG